MTYSNLYVIIKLLIHKNTLDPWKLGKGGNFMNQYVYNFAENLHRICKEQKISVGKLSESIGKSPRQISRYRNGQCKNLPLDVVTKTADKLGVSITDLLS